MMKYTNTRLYICILGLQLIATTEPRTEYDDFNLTKTLILWVHTLYHLYIAVHRWRTARILSGKYRYNIFHCSGIALSTALLLLLLAVAEALFLATHSVQSLIFADRCYGPNSRSLIKFFNVVMWKEIVRYHSRQFRLVIEPVVVRIMVTVLADRYVTSCRQPSRVNWSAITVTTDLAVPYNMIKIMKKAQS